MRRHQIRLWGGLAALLAGETAGQPADGVTIAAASDLKFVLEAIETEVLRPLGLPVRIVFGSSGNLARQILQGAPFDLFMSADESLVFRLADAGVTADRGHVYGIGRLMLIAPAIPARPVLSADLHAELQAAPRIAIANPELAPYGQAARQALKALGFEDELRKKWVVGDNVSQATQFVLTGAAPLGFSAMTLVSAPNISARLTVQSVPALLYSPLRQRMVMLRRANSRTAEIYSQLLSAGVRALFARFGLEQS